MINKLHWHQNVASCKAKIPSVLVTFVVVLIASVQYSSLPFATALKVRPPYHKRYHQPRRDGLHSPSPILFPDVQRQAVRRLSKTHHAIDILRGGNEKAQSFMEERPFVSAIIITTFKAIAADLMTQLVLTSGHDPWDARRTALFGAFGLLYQGCAQYAIVNWGWERLFPGNSNRAVISKVCCMNLISDPFLFLPVFYLFKQSFGDGELSWQVLLDAFAAYKANAGIDIRNSWLVWFPGHTVTYGVMPAHKRIPWMAFLSFFYMCVLSLTRGGKV